MLFERDIGEVEKIALSQIKNLEKKGLLDYDVNPRAKFNLDSHKIYYHQDRLKAFLRGEKVAPITMDMALTQKCTYNCVFCYANLQQHPSSPADWDVYESFLDDAVDIGHKKGEGVKGISLVSDGESTLSPHYYKFIQKGKENGIDMSSGTNGFALKNEELPELVNNLTYLRFNFDAGEPEAYSQIMGTPKESFYKVVNNIEKCVKLKKEQKSDITIGLQMVLLPDYADQVIPLALLGKDLGVDYTVIKHCTDDEKRRLGIDYSWYKGEMAEKLLKTAEALSTKDYSVQAKWSKIKTGGDRIYERCYGPPLFLQISGSGIVAPCGSFFHPRYTKFQVGDIKTKRFKEIWESDEYWNVMNLLGSKGFNAKTDCAQLCLQDKVNEELFKIIEKGKAIPDISSKKTIPHKNFI